MVALLKNRLDWSVGLTTSIAPNLLSEGVGTIQVEINEVKSCWILRLAYWFNSPSIAGSNPTLNNTLGNP